MGLPGPQEGTSIAVAIIAPLASILMVMVVTPFLFNAKLRVEFPNNLIPWIGVSTIFACVGLFIGIAYDFNPDLYAGETLCGFQWGVIGTGAVWALLLIFFYTFGLYQLVVQRKHGKHISHQSRYIVIGTGLVAFLFSVVLPFAFPFEYDNGETVIFGPQGPWCSPKDFVPFVILFYLPTLVPAIISIVMAFRIVLTVYKTTKATKALSTFSSSDVTSTPKSNSSHDKRVAARNRQLYRFYARISLFVIAYCAASVVSFVRRIQELSKGIDGNAPNDSTMGTSIAIPVLALIEGLVLLSTPAVSRFYTKRIPGLKPISSTTENASDRGNTAIEPSKLQSNS